MKIINRATEGIVTLYNSNNWATISKSGTLRFGRNAVSLCNLKDGIYMHFLFDEKNWYFFTNDDDTGFKIRMREKRSSAEISSRSLLNMITEKKYYKGMIISKTKIDHDHNEVFKIKLV